MKATSLHQHPMKIRETNSNAMGGTLNSNARIAIFMGVYSLKHVTSAAIRISNFRIRKTVDMETIAQSSQGGSNANNGKVFTAPWATNLLGQQFDFALSFDGTTTPSSPTEFPTFSPLQEETPPSISEPMPSHDPTLISLPTLNPTTPAPPSTNMIIPTVAPVKDAPTNLPARTATPSRSTAPTRTFQPTRSPSNSSTPSAYPNLPTTTFGPTQSPPVSSNPTISWHPSTNTPTTFPHPPPSPTTPLGITEGPATMVSSPPQQSPSPNSPTSTTITQPPATSPAPQDSSSPAPTLFPNEIVFRCTDGGVVELASPPFGQIVRIPIAVGYLVESLFFTSEYLPVLHDLILETSVVSALQCNDDEGDVFGPNGTIPFLPMTTTLTGAPCTPLDSICTTLQTEFEFWVQDETSPETGAFFSYISLQENMDGGIFASQIPEVDRLQYLSPLPLLPPQDEPNSDPAELQADGNIASVSPYTMGAVVAMSLSGLLALGAWARNRRTRNNRHMHLLENMSFDSPQEPRV